MEQFIRRQNIAIFRRLLNEQTDNDEARRQRLLQLLAAEEAKGTDSWQRNPPDNVCGGMPGMQKEIEN